MNEPWPLLTATAGLTAFHIGLYTLVGRERKSPYLINSIFPIFLFALFTAAAALVSTFLNGKFQMWTMIASKTILAYAFIYSFFVIFRVTIRFKYFVDSINIKHLPIIRPLRRLKYRFGRKPTYEHHPIPVPDDVENEINSILKNDSTIKYTDKCDSTMKSMSVKITHQSQCNDLLAKLSELFFRHDFTVQYLTASRHPIEFIEHLKGYIEAQKVPWAQYAQKLVVIDAYSPHFGFVDSIYEHKTRALEFLNIHCETSQMTYAGMHSAATRAFKTVQKKAGKGAPRKPTLVIYEGSYALSDLESPEQYRVFVRHVLPSERAWGGMLTVFIESAQPENDWKILKTYTSIALEFEELKINN